MQLTLCLLVLMVQFGEPNPILASFKREDMLGPDLLLDVFEEEMEELEMLIRDLQGGPITKDIMEDINKKLEEVEDKVIKTAYDQEAYKQDVLKTAEKNKDIEEELALKKLLLDDMDMDKDDLVRTIVVATSLVISCMALIITIARRRNSRGYDVRSSVEQI